MQLTSSHRGYTLIELLVSLSIFAIVMLAATAAYLSFINYNRQAQTTATVVNSLYFSMDSMARDIRTGTGYTCVGGVCSSDGVTKITFKDSDGCTVSYETKANVYPGVTSIVRSESGSSPCFSQNQVAITDPSIDVTSLLFYVRGWNPGDSVQAETTLVLRGEADVPNSTVVVPFDIETTATERIPDI